jgi:hypothetical protein
MDTPIAGGAPILHNETRGMEGRSVPSSIQDEGEVSTRIA